MRHLDSVRWCLLVFALTAGTFDSAAQTVVTPRVLPTRTGWRMNNNNASKTNQSHASGPLTAPVFESLISNPIGLLSKIGPDGSTYFLSRPGGPVVLSVYSSSGVLKWSVPLPDSGFTAVQDDAIAIGLSGTVFVATNNQGLIALNGDTGAIAWNYLIPNSGSRIVLDSNDNIYLVAGGVPSHVVALTPTGSEKWKRDFGLRSVLSRDESTLYVADGSSLFAISSLEGTTWSSTTGIVDIDTVGADGSIYVFANSGRKVCSPDLQTCVAAKNQMQYQLVLDQFGLVVGEDYFNNSGLVATDQAGNIAWQAFDAAAIADVNGIIYAGSKIAPRTIVALNGATGAELWRQQLPGTVQCMGCSGVEGVDGRHDALLGDDGGLYMQVLKIGGGSAVYRSAAADTGTVSAPGLPHSIPNPGQMTFTLNYPTAGTIASMDLFFQFTHQCENDLTMDLLAPDGHSVRVMNHGLMRCSGIATTFTSDNTQVGQPQFFGGHQSQGTWKLIVTDTAAGNSGTLDTWRLSIVVAPVLPPRVIVVPGFGASTLTDSSGNNQWLSCFSIPRLHAGNLSAVQYDKMGNPLLGLQPTEVLMQSDGISDLIKPSNKSVLQCNNADLRAIALDAAGWAGDALTLECFNGFRSDAHECAQHFLLDHSHGVLLQFNALLSSLAAGGHDPIGWPYDFRRGVSVLADDLYSTIHQVSVSDRGRHIAIVTHSMGSLVTAAMIQRHPDVYDSGLLETIISMGAPFAGAIKSYLAATGGDIFVPFVSVSNTKEMGQNWTSVYDLLPQWDFVTRLDPPYLTKDQIFDGTGDPADFPAMSRVSALPGAYEQWDRLRTLGPLNRWYAIIGFGFPTKHQITERQRLDLSTYTLGHPCMFIDYSDGDGTVPLRSSQFGLIVPTSNRIYVNQEHAMLPKDSAVIDGISKLLQRLSPFTVSGLKAQPSQFTIPPSDQFKGCSPIDLVAINSAGQTVSNDGVEITGADYARVSGSTQISVPSIDSYTLHVNGTGLGTFELVIRHLDGNQQPTQTYVVSGIAGPQSTRAFQVGSASSGTVKIDLMSTFEGALTDIANALRLGLIDNAGLANSLSQKLSVARDATGEGARSNTLSAFVNEVNGQAGKHITGIAVQVLLDDAGSLASQNAR